MAVDFNRSHCTIWHGSHLQLVCVQGATLYWVSFTWNEDYKEDTEMRVWRKEEHIAGSSNAIITEENRYRCLYGFTDWPASLLNCIPEQTPSWHMVSWCRWFWKAPVGQSSQTWVTRRKFLFSRLGKFIENTGTSPHHFAQREEVKWTLLTPKSLFKYRNQGSHAGPEKWVARRAPGCSTSKRERCVPVCVREAAAASVVELEVEEIEGFVTGVSPWRSLHLWP